MESPGLASPDLGLNILSPFSPAWAVAGIRGAGGVGAGAAGAGAAGVILTDPAPGTAVEFRVLV